MKVDKVHVVGQDYLIHKMFSAAGYEMVETVNEADTLVFTGGADVPPEMYGEKNVAASCNPAREIREKKVYDKWVGVKNMIGICRGSQFLNVMNGGKLWQHVDNHGISGTHAVLDLESGKEHQCTSTHHQMMRTGPSSILVAVSAEDSGSGYSTVRVSSEGARARADGEEDVEVVWYPLSSSLCFQGHPEYDSEDCRKYFLGLVDKYYIGD